MNEGPGFYNFAAVAFDNRVTWQAIAAALAVFVALVTFVLTRRRDNRLRRAELVQKYSAALSDSEVLFRQFCEIDNDHFAFENDEEWIGKHPDWLDGEPERSLIRLLDLFNSVGHNVEHGVLKTKDLYGTTLWYAIVRALNDPGVRNYLQWVDQWDADHRGTGQAFLYFRRLRDDVERAGAWDATIRAPEDDTTEPSRD